MCIRDRLRPRKVFPATHWKKHFEKQTTQAISRLADQRTADIGLNLSLNLPVEIIHFVVLVINFGNILSITSSSYIILNNDSLSAPLNSFEDSR